MAKHVKNMNELEKALQPVMMGMVDKMAERVEQTLNYFLQEYYNSYSPVYTGEEIATFANQGTHGGTIQGNNTPHVWDDTIDETVNNGELLKLAMVYI